MLRVDLLISSNPRTEQSHDSRQVGPADGNDCGMGSHRWEQRGVYCAFQMTKSFTDNLSTHTAIATTQMPINMDESMGEMVASLLKMVYCFSALANLSAK